MHDVIYYMMYQQQKGFFMKKIIFDINYTNDEVNIIAKVLSVDGQKEILHKTQTNLSNLNEEMERLIDLFERKGAKSLIL